VDLLRRHGLGFDDAPRFGPPRDLDDDAARVFGGRGPVDLAAELQHRRFELFEVAVQVRQRVFLEALGVVAEAVAVRQGGVAAAVAGQQRAGQAHQRRLQRRVGLRLPGGAREVVVLVPRVVVA
jgi:hypothetical protein